jgi:poly-gamma-glutamate capsule biosynthesis protein CapA/YwtB (metallophosphatase superfamily)
MLALCLRAAQAHAEGPAPAPAPKDTVTMLAVGDVMLSRAVADKIKRHKDIHFPFLHISDWLKSADITFANLECPITKGRIIKHGMVFRADPGVELVSLANNHLPDFGAKGVLDTVAALDALGIAHAGAGKDDEEANRPAIVVREGIRFAFLAYNDPGVVPERYGASKDHPGTSFIDQGKAVAAIAAARKTADIVIVSMHYGWEYRKANPYQAAFAKAAIDAGAELVIGHHPHVIQRVERYKGKLILYSLGNFVFDQAFSTPVKQGLSVKLTFNKAGVQSARFVPVLIENLAQPRVVTEEKLRKKILKRLEIALADDGTLLPEVPAPPRKPARPPKK